MTKWTWVRLTPGFTPEVQRDLPYESIHRELEFAVREEELLVQTDRLYVWVQGLDKALVFFIREDLL